MNRFPRILIAVAVLSAGLALAPHTALPSERLGWQRYAGVYQPSPAQISIQNFTFVPNTRLIPAGTTVRWTNNDAVGHTVTSSSPGLFDSGELGSGATFDHAFAVPGTYAYFCAIHPNMQGTITVAAEIFDIDLPVVIK